MARIAMILCYYGKFPWYFRLFLKTAAYNKDIHFWLVTDIPTDIPLPDNVFVTKRSLEELRVLFSSRLGFPVRLEEPYKLCDFKPAYGFLFADFIKEYEFWGHGDIDVIYGNLRSFITDEVLDKNDVISMRREYLSGFFTLYRNSPVATQLFMESADYRYVFQDPGNHCFDETNWLFRPLLAGKSIFELKMESQCMSYVVKKQTLCGNIQSYFYTHATEDIPGRLEWKEGELIFSGDQPVALYHMVKFKDLIYSHVPDWQAIPERFFINTFYISRYPPGSLKGVLTAAVLYPCKLLQTMRRHSFHYLAWLKRYFRCTRKVRAGDFPELQDYLGQYGPWKEQTVRVFLSKDRLFAQIDQEKPLQLLHEKGKCFMISDYKVQEDGRNLDVQFVVDAERQGLAMLVIPQQQPPYVIRKMSSTL